MELTFDLVEVEKIPPGSSLRVGRVPGPVPGAAKRGQGPGVVQHPVVTVSFDLPEGSLHV